MESQKDTGRWDITLWLWAGLCSIAIFSFIPLARGLQRYVYSAFGKEAFTYAVIFIFAAVMAQCLYFLIFRLKVKNISQYVWLCFSGAVYIYSAVYLRKYPEEAVHLLEYGLLAFFVFRAVNYRIHDWTSYISSGLIVIFAGTMDEFIQWMTPERVGSLKDIGLNGFSGALFLLTFNKCFKPDAVKGKAAGFSFRFLSATAVAALLFLGLCLYIFN